MKRAADISFLRNFTYKEPRRAQTRFTIADVRCCKNKEPDGLYTIVVEHDAPQYGDIDESIQTMCYDCTFSITCTGPDGAVVHAESIEVECDYYVSGSVNCECTVVRRHPRVTASVGLMSDLIRILEKHAGKCWERSILDYGVVLEALSTRVESSSEDEEGK